MQPFAMYELLFYILPILMSVIIVRFIRPLLPEFKAFRLTTPMLLLPLWVVIIEGFGWRLYELSVFPYWCYMVVIVLWIHYFEYIRKVESFEYQAYLRAATNVVFMMSTLLLLSIGIFRIGHLVWKMLR
ncbi:MAG: hypothetical protein Q4A10_05200 [Aerococcaceae bacterium]|nr:hypothetical protein [Aerococcaceae bacterium]